jgi:large subunit ribosomal protein L4
MALSLELKFNHKILQMKLSIFTQTGEKKGQIEAPENFFDVAYNPDLIHQALVRQHANSRQVLAHTKTKGEVRGGGRKPYRQKGTGHARQGSIRNPHYKGGGVAFGPRNDRNYKKDMPKKQRRLAIFSALSEKARNEKVIALESFDNELPKTKMFAELIAKLPVKRNVLVVIDEPNFIVQKSTSNLPSAKTILVNYLNIADLQKYDSVLFMEKAVGKLSEIFN